MISFPSRLGSHADLLGRMIRTCGVDPAHLSHDRPDTSFRVFARTCMACDEADACRAWLDRAEFEGVQDPPDFCPNAARLRRARRD